MAGTEGGAILVPLSEHEMTRLAHCEAVIKKGISTFVSVGAALTEIRELALYKAQFESFDTYVRERWGFSKQRAHQICSAAILSRMLRDTPTKSGESREILPINERQLRALSGVDEEHVPHVWDSAVDAAGGRIPTNREVEDAVRRFENEQPASSREALHSSKSVEWHTPPHILDAVRNTLGGFDLDPASCAEASVRVGAADWIGLPEDGLVAPWHGRVWCNPPYGTLDGHSQQAVWLQKAVTEVGRGACDVVAMLLNAHVGTKWFRTVWQYPVCILDDRVRFLRPDGKPGDTPTHGSVIVLVTLDPVEFESQFVKAMRGLGVVSLPTEFGDVVEVGELLDD